MGRRHVAEGERAVARDVPVPAGCQPGGRDLVGFVEDLRCLAVGEPGPEGEGVGLLEPGVPVTRRTSPGAAGPEAVADQLRRFREHLSYDEDRLGHD